MMFVIDLSGATCTATCHINMITFSVVKKAFLMPTTSCEMPSSVNAKFVEQDYTSVITEEDIQTTLTVVNLNVATFSPITSPLTINDLADKTVTATCAIDFTSVTVEDSTVSIPTTSCEMPSGIAASFFAVTRTTEVTVNNIVTTLNVTDLAVPTYFAVKQSLNIINPQGISTEATCTVSFTKVSISSSTVDLKTTSCSMSQDFGGEFVEAFSTTIVSISVIPVTVTVTNINNASFAPAKITKTITDPTGASVKANCFAQFSKTLVSTSTFSVLTTSCSMPTDVSGTFTAHIQSTDLVINDFTTSVTFTNIDSPYFSPILTTISLTNPAGTTGVATCAIDFTFAAVADATISIPTTSCELGTDLTGKFVTSVSTTVFTQGNITTTLEVTNKNQPSFLAEQAYVTPIINDDGDSIDATCEVGSTKFTVPGTTLAIPTTSCEFPEGIIGTYEYVYVTTVFSTGSFTTTIVVTNSILGKEWTRAYKTVTSTTTVVNDICAFETLTSTNPPVRGTVVKIIAVATPADKCPVTTRTAQNSVCSMVKITTTTVDAGSRETVYEELVLTPAETCNIIYTTVSGTDCNSHRHTSMIVTYSDSSHINATLIVVETPAGSACLSSSHIFPSITIASTTSSMYFTVVSSTSGSFISSSQSGIATTSTSSIQSDSINGNVANHDTTNTADFTSFVGTHTQTANINEGHTIIARSTKTLTVTCTKAICTHVPIANGSITVTEEGVDTVIVTVTCSTNSEGSVITVTGDHTVAGTENVESIVVHTSVSRPDSPSSSSKDNKPPITTTSGFQGSAPHLYKRSNEGTLLLFGILAILF
ncbi:hypothetical protein CANINC_000750 [Pichia inconspicua]|uniref:Uncharacterized protein n=1 Tax=Pichia inconspicua TaxID=52247 RepID=A0A4T0X5K2_9ASCO|nr:hypothetical protein CANINC_000750 [[Candida] inconspicua]